MSAAVGVSPYDVVAKSDLEKAVFASEGFKVTVDSFEIIDFTKKGDNFISIVSSVAVKYRKIGTHDVCSGTFVIKLKPIEENKFFIAQLKVFFFKEIAFYANLVPLLNNELKGKTLAVPKMLHSAASEDVLYFEDMRQSGFVMTDGRRGMDYNHSKLVISELAKLHAASSLLMGDSFEQQFPFVRAASKMLSESGSTFDLSVANHLRFDCAIEVLKNFEVYRPLVDDLLKRRDRMRSRINNNCLRVLCHNDCWSNNFLFKYDSSLVPSECCIVDLQVYKVGSPAVDLGKVLFTSIAPETMKNSSDELLEVYYQEFSSIFTAKDKTVPFTLEKLKEEFVSQSMHSLLVGLLIIPGLFEVDDFVVVENFTEAEGTEKTRILKSYTEAVINKVKTDAQFKARYFSLFDIILSM